jgi:hypothetical protein
VPPRTCDGAPTGTEPSIRHVDWCNQTYRSGIDSVEVIGGEHEEHVYVCDAVPGHEGEHITELWRLGEVAYGDIDGDGTEDAAVTFDEYGFACRDEDDQRQTRLRLYVFRDGEVRFAGETTLELVDDRRLGALPALAIGTGEISRTYTWRDGTTCTDRWRSSYSELVPVGTPCP